MVYERSGRTFQILTAAFGGGMPVKRILCIVLTLALLLSLPAAAFAAKDMKLSLETEVSGKKLTVELWCEDNPGVSSLELTLSYNKKALKCTSCELAGSFGRMMAAENPNASAGAKISAASARNIEGDGLMAVYEFDIVGSGDYALQLVNILLVRADGSDISYSITGAEDKPAVTPPAAVQPQLPFSDMKGHWAQSYLVKGYDRGILAGYPDGSCRPNENVTRAQFVTFLWRSVGEPKPTKASTFKDLNPSAKYYLDAVAWAQEKGYIEGVGDGLFLPANPISRQEVALILWRVAGGVSGGEMMFTDIYNKHFTDSSRVSTWAKSAVYWAVYNEVWCGKGSVDAGKTLAARDNASRAEIVVMMIKYQDKFER